MKHARTLAPLLALGLILVLPAAVPATEAPSGRVVVNGLPVERAVSFLDATVELVEYRDGSSPNVVRLVPGPKRYGVCLVSPGPIKMLDAELPVADTPDRFTVVVEDGREFSACLMADLKQVPSPRERLRDHRGGPLYKYCLRCEDVTTPVSIP